MSVRPLCAAAAGLLVLGLVLHIVGLATPAWGIIKSTDVEIGLWKSCFPHQGCRDWPTEPDYLKASQAMALLGMIALLGAIAAAGAVIYFIHTGHECPQLIRVASLVIAFVAAMCIFIAVIVMIVKMKGENSSVKLGYSSGFSIAAICLILAGGVLGFHGARSFSPI